jgi:class 3 adenylate cyclase
LLRLKAEERTKHIPVIVISALDELDSVVRCIEAGAEDYLPKPFDPVLLRTRIDSSLEKKWLRDREKQFIAELEREKHKSETLLLNILPSSIADRMRNGELVIADMVTESTILFCDLVGFTALSGRLSAAHTVDFLGQIFTTFDRLAAEAGVEKIKTIGDAYMACAGVPVICADHAEVMAEMALAMREALKAHNREFGSDLQIRIGINSGPVVAGVIGLRKFIYDLWGDTVNLASRMESNGIPDKIQVSSSTWERLRDRYEFEARGDIEVKGIGSVKAYLLTGKRPE